MVITIDGPAGTGKSTVALAVAERLGFDFLDTGAMYRAIGLAALRREANLEDPRELTFIARHAKINFDWDKHPPGVYLNGEPVGHLLRGGEATRAASYVAVVPAIRELLVAAAAADRPRARQPRHRRPRPGHGRLPAGRAEVLPRRHARRARAAARRAAPHRGEIVDYQEILNQIVARDHRDASRVGRAAGGPEGRGGHRHDDDVAGPGHRPHRRAREGSRGRWRVPPSRRRRSLAVVYSFMRALLRILSSVLVRPEGLRQGKRAPGPAACCWSRTTRASSTPASSACSSSGSELPGQERAVREPGLRLAHPQLQRVPRAAGRGRRRRGEGNDPPAAGRSHAQHLPRGRPLRGRRASADPERRGAGRPQGRSADRARGDRRLVQGVVEAQEDLAAAPGPRPVRQARRSCTI